MSDRRRNGQVLVAAMMVLALMGVDRSWGQDASGPFPRFRDGVKLPPAAAMKNPAFDIAKAFEAPPFEENAAPLYLDALFEFDGGLMGCFPVGPEREARAKSINDRMQPFEPLREAFDKDPNSVAAADLDAILAEYETGFRKLAEAQKRERCVFQTGVGFYALLPHVQAARQVVQVAVIKVKRELDKGEIDAAIDDVKTVLRLTRDLQPRGYLISQLVVAANTTVTGQQLINPILSAPGLKPEHCDKLLAVLNEYEAKSVDPYVTSLQQEYVGMRVSLWDAILHQDSLSQTMGLPPRKSFFEKLFDRLRGRPPQQSIGATLFQPAQTAIFKKGEPLPAATPLPDDIDEQLAGTTPEELDRVVEKLKRYYTAVLVLKDRTRGEQMANAPDPNRFIPGNDLLSVIVRESQPSPRYMAEVFGRTEAALRASKALTAIRRWQLTHNGASPADLTEACKAAGLKATPSDPFDGKPLRLVEIDGKPVVYSIGKDEKDDGGKIDSNLDKQPGDLIYSLSAGPK